MVSRLSVQPGRRNLLLLLPGPPQSNGREQQGNREYQTPKGPVRPRKAPKGPVRPGGPGGPGGPKKKTGSGSKVEEEQRKCRRLAKSSAFMKNP